MSPGGNRSTCAGLSKGAMVPSGAPTALPRLQPPGQAEDVGSKSKDDGSTRRRPGRQLGTPGTPVRRNADDAGWWLRATRPTVAKTGTAPGGPMRPLSCDLSANRWPITAGASVAPLPAEYLRHPQCYDECELPLGV